MYLSRPNETLKEHINRVKSNYNNLKGNFSYNIYGINTELINDLFDNVIYYHDYGKMNPYFQEYINGNRNIGKEKREHSKLSTIKYLNDMYLKYIDTITGGRKSISKKKMLCKIIINLSYNILRHHGNLIDKKEDGLYLHELIEHYNHNMDKYINLDIDINNIIKIKNYNTNEIKFNNGLEVGFMFKYNYCLLIQSDYMAVYEYKNNKKLTSNILDESLRDKLITNFKSDTVIQGIYKYKNNEIKLSEINSHRSDMFLESENELLKNLNKHIFFLESPTGSGKSNTGMNLAFDLVNKINNHIIYISPSNNVTDQTYATTKEKIKSNDNEMAIINNRQGIIHKDEYDTDYLNYQTLNYPIVMTSHVKLFNILFGNNKNDLLGFNSIRNSVIILDEIQNYNNKNWIKQINCFCVLCKMFNIKMIIMSATLPKMTELITQDNIIDTVDLIHNTDKYYKFFKNRVTYDYSLLDSINKKEKNNINEIFEKINHTIDKTNKHRILIETLTVKHCEEFYKYLKEKYPNYKVFKMLSSTNLVARKHIIDLIQSKNSNGEYKYKEVILVGTQCIEAGIDIDMNIGFKDISTLDSDEQFIGRLERNFKDIGICYFFDLDNDEFIYKDDYRIENNLKYSQEYRDIFENKKFDTYYNKNYKWLLKKEMDNYDIFYDYVEHMQYEKIKQSMKLIDNETYSFLFLCKFNNINSKDILDKLKINEEEKDYCKKQIKKKELIKDLNKFIVSINTFNFKEEPTYNKEMGYYIVDNGQEYFSDIDNNELTEISDLIITKFIHNKNNLNKDNIQYIAC